MKLQVEEKVEKVLVGLDPKKSLSELDKDR